MFSTRRSIPLKPLRTITIAAELTKTPTTDISEIILIILLDFFEKRYLLAIKLDRFTISSKVVIVHNN
tara:strand:- start:595 stop:798 length:204 start_codon:yes stop_codon:yes gene_type:complete